MLLEICKKTPCPFESYKLLRFNKSFIFVILTVPVNWVTYSNYFCYYASAVHLFHNMLILWKYENTCLTVCSDETKKYIFVSNNNNNYAIK